MNPIEVLESSIQNRSRFYVISVMSSCIILEGVVANSNPRVDNLKLGRGKRPKLNNITVGMRMSPETKARLEEIAEHFDCTYGGKPWIAGLLEKIGSQELIVSAAPGYLVSAARAADASPDRAAQPSQPRVSCSDIDTAFEDDVVERYGELPSVTSKSEMCTKEFQHDSEHRRLPKNSG